MTAGLGTVAGKVDDAGVWLAHAPREPLVVSFDGRYVWSFSAVRDGTAARGGVLVPWPRVLEPFLVGHASVRVAEAVSGQVLLDADVVLGNGQGRVAVADKAGHPLAVDKVGHLCRSFDETDETVRQEILSATGRVLTDLREHCGVEAYLNYGALLGAVRDGAMIAHDSDTDVCYLSRAASPADLILESYRVQRELRSRGWRLLRMSGGDIKVLQPLSDGRVCHIDVFVAFRVAETFYQLGNRSGHLPETAILPVSTISLHGHEFPAPADPEAMLAFVYGPGWRVPDPSFRYADPVAGVRRLDGWLRGFRTEMGSWSEFFDRRRRAVPKRPSDFARWVHGQLPPGDAVAELGAGTGRDAVWYARRRPVRAYDFSRRSLRLVRRRAARAGVDVTVELVVLGETRSVLSLGAELARSPHHLVARELVGCLDQAARANLYRLARMALRASGGSLFLEFSARSDEHPYIDAPPGPEGLVRRFPPDVLRREVEAAGGLVEHEELGPGTDMLGHHDPLVCRMRVRFPGPSSRPTERQYR